MMELIIMQSRAEMLQDMTNPFILTIIYILLLVPGFFGLGFIAIKLVTFFLISNKAAINFGIFCSVIGLIWALTLGYFM